MYRASLLETIACRSFALTPIPESGTFVTLPNPAVESTLFEHELNRKQEKL
jgi:hypothetical protein